MSIMRVQIVLLLVFFIVSSFQCDKCIEKDRFIGEDRIWIPLEGFRQVPFLDEAGNEVKFDMNVTDTIGTFNNEDCSATFRSQSAELVLYLDVNRTDSISVLLGPASSICMLGTSGNILYMSTCRFLSTQTGRSMIHLEDYKVGARIYRHVRLFLANEGNDKSLDSVFLARSSGVVGFKYKNTNYVLK